MKLVFLDKRFKPHNYLYFSAWSLHLMSLKSVRDVAINPIPPLPHEGEKKREAEKETLAKVKKLKLKIRCQVRLSPKGKTPVPVCSPKLSPVGRGWYLGGWPSRWNTQCCTPCEVRLALWTSITSSTSTAKCCMWIEFQSISTWPRGFPPGTPVSSLIKIVF